MIAAPNQEEIALRLVVARGLIAQAGELAARCFADIASLTVTSKGPQDMASEADVQVETLIRDGLKAAFPTDAFFGEETGAAALDGAAVVWVVDPIDGTQPFLSGLSSWCISIACVVGGTIELGLVLSPPTHDLFVARRGFGSTLNGRPIQPHPGRTLGDGITSLGYSARVPGPVIVAVLDRLLAGGGMFYRNGSGTLSLCHVACGRLLGYVEPHINSWDCLAAILIITEAGGRTNDFLTGDALLKGNRIVAGPAAVYDALAALLEP